MVCIYKIALPDYRLDRPLDYATIGQRVDAVIRRHFQGRAAGLRYLGLQDHPGMSLQQLPDVILTEGTDRYDPERQMSVAHDWYVGFGVELFVGRVQVDDSMEYFAEVSKLFVEGARVDRGYSVRVDLITVYDLDQLECIPIEHGPGDIEDCGHRFKFPERKAESVLGVVQIL